MAAEQGVSCLLLQGVAPSPVPGLLRKKRADRLQKGDPTPTKLWLQVDIDALNPGFKPPTLPCCPWVSTLA